MSRFVLIASSLVCHALIAVLLGEIRVEKASAATPITITEVARAPEPPPPPPPVETPKAPEPAEAPRRAPAAPMAKPAEAAPAPSSFEQVPDFGLALEGGVSGGGVPVRAAADVAPREPQRVKQLSQAPAPAPKSGCSEAASKPKPISVPQPGYTEQARAAGIEGKVRVQLTVDEQGRVIEVEVLQGLGHGLDEAALAAARSASFAPAQRCGRPVSATFTIAMRFSSS